MSDDLANAPTEHDAVPETGAAGIELDRIGRFELREVLGSGGMGMVVSAHDPDLGRDVALKLLHSTGDGAGRTRLIREARAMAQLRHPNILTIYEVGTHDDDVYVAMERIEGGTLAEALRREPAPDWRQIVKLFVAAGEGLDAAHRAGLVHRDFKPSNVLVEGDRVLVADFGLVSTPDEAVELAGDSSLSDDLLEPLTRADVVLGTPAYMAPEQHAGGPIDGRTDQFSFSVALHEALDGQLPFAGNNRREYLEAIYAGAVRAPRRDNVPSWIREAIDRGLSARRDDRFASMRELLDQLTVSPQKRQLGRRLRIIGLVMFSALVLAWAAASWTAHLQITYPQMAAIDLGCLALLGSYSLFIRADLVEGSFNRQIFGFALAAVSAVLVLVGGCWLGDVPAANVAALHLFTTFSFSLAAIVLIDRRVAIIAAGYLIGFVVAVARPPLFFPASLLSHSVMAATLYLILGDIRVRHEASRAPPAS